MENSKNTVHYTGWRDWVTCHSSAQLRKVCCTVYCILYIMPGCILYNVYCILCSAVKYMRSNQHTQSSGQISFFFLLFITTSLYLCNINTLYLYIYYTYSSQNRLSRFYVPKIRMFNIVITVVATSCLKSVVYSAKM